MARTSLNQLMNTQTHLDQNSKPFTFMGMNPISLLGNLVETLPDSVLEDCANKVCEMAEQVKIIRQNQNVEIIEHHSEQN